MEVHCPSHLHWSLVVALKPEGTTACILIDVIAMMKGPIFWQSPIKLVVPGFSQHYDSLITPAKAQILEMTSSLVLVASVNSLHSHPHLH